MEGKDENVYTPAAAQVFAIPELLEIILVHVGANGGIHDMKALFTLQRVNTTFQKVITTSKTIRQMMYLEYIQEAIYEGPSHHVCRFEHKCDQLTHHCKKGHRCDNGRQWKLRTLNPVAEHLYPLRFQNVRCLNVRTISFVSYTVDIRDPQQPSERTTTRKWSTMDKLLDRPGSWRQMRLLATPCPSELCIYVWPRRLGLLRATGGRMESGACLGDLADTMVRETRGILKGLEEPPRRRHYPSHEVDA